MQKLGGYRLGKTLKLRDNAKHNSDSEHGKEGELTPEITLHFKIHLEFLLELFDVEFTSPPLLPLSSSTGVIEAPINLEIGVVITSLLQFASWTSQWSLKMVLWKLPFFSITYIFFKVVGVLDTWVTNCISRHTVNFVSPTYSLTAFQIVGKEVQRIEWWFRFCRGIGEICCRLQ